MKIERYILEDLRLWKESDNRKPILLQGARQIGKTWAMEEFGHECYKHVQKFDFDRQPELKGIFETTKEPDRIIKELALYSKVPLLAGETLIIFDEIQECEAALNSLKYFYEDAPGYHIIAAGSLLGVAVKKKRMTVPVGKVTIMRMYPFTFKEFLRADDEPTFNFIEQLQSIEHLPEIIMNKLTSAYRRYQVCGGMPEAAVAMIENKGTEAVDTILQDILDLYELDFAKYAEPKEIPRIRAVWHSLPAQLAKENRKFIYKVIRSGARSKDYEDALMWLTDAGLIYRIENISRPGIPMSAYKDSSVFKVYASDCGLLRRLAGLPATTIIDPIANYVEFKGAMAENIVLQNLIPLLDNQIPAYWTSDATAEVEFVIQWGSEIIPIEVKAEGNINGNSLALYNKKYEPDLRVRFSMLNLQYNCGLLSAPAPLAPWFGQLFALSQSIRQ